VASGCFRKSLLPGASDSLNTTSDVHRMFLVHALLFFGLRTNSAKCAVVGRVFDPHVLRGCSGTLPAFMQITSDPERCPITVLSHALGFASAFGPLLIAYRRQHRLISWSAPRYRGDYGGFDALAFRCSPPNGSRVSEQVSAEPSPWPGGLCRP